MKKLILILGLMPGMAWAQTVKPDSIWFVSRADLDSWERDHSVQEEMLHSREAMQFGNSQPVKIVRSFPKLHETEVLMTGPGRFQGTAWWVDDRDILKNQMKKLILITQDSWCQGWRWLKTTS